MALDVTAAESVELFLQLERLDMLGNISHEQTHLFFKISTL